MLYNPSLTHSPERRLKMSADKDLDSDNPPVTEDDWPSGPVHIIDGSKKGSKTRRKRRTKGPSDKIRSLAAISLANKVGYLKLSDLTGGENRAVEAALERLPKKNFKAGENVYSSSQRGQVACLVRSGKVNIVRTSATGRDLPIKTVEAGTIFGDLPALGQSMFGAKAIAAEAAKVSYISAGDFDKLAAASPSVAANIAKRLGERLVAAEKRHEQSAFQPVTARIAMMLLEGAGSGNEVTGLTHQQIAERLGVYRETVTHAIAELKGDKLIKVGRKRLTVLDKNALRKLATI
jgi:CRP-like cAMP-binding protein